MSNQCGDLDVDLDFSFGCIGGGGSASGLALANTGVDITVGNRSEATGKFNFVIGDDGDVSFDSTEAHAVMTSVIERKGSYAFDPNHGSELLNLKNLTSQTPSQAESMALDAVLPLEDNHSITNVSAVASADRRRGRLLLDLNWTTPAGNAVSQTVEL